MRWSAAKINCRQALFTQLSAQQTAGECSATVAALVALVTPLPYSADFRPYFTIHDPAFARMAGGQLPCGANRLPRLLGITNLYILKVCLALQLSWMPHLGECNFACFCSPPRPVEQSAKVWREDLLRLPMHQHLLSKEPCNLC